MSEVEDIKITKGNNPDYPYHLAIYWETVWWVSEISYKTEERAQRDMLAYGKQLKIKLREGK